MTEKTPKISNILQHNGKQDILEDFTKLMKLMRYVLLSILSYKYQAVLSEILKSIAAAL